MPDMEGGSPAAGGAPTGGGGGGAYQAMVGSYSKMALGHRAYPEAAFNVGGARGGPAGASSTFVPVGSSQYSGPASTPVGMGGAVPPQQAGQMGGFVPPGQAQGPTFNPLFNCPRRYIRFTTNCIPATSQLQGKSHMPLGAVIHPLAQPTSQAEVVPVVNFGGLGIIRCRRCRSYINHGVQFTDGGRRWRCNLCDLPNDVPNEYFCTLDSEGRRSDVHERPELSSGIVEFIAPNEYMVRPPQPPVFFFLVDVSYYAVASGMLATFAQAARKNLDHLASLKAFVGLITYDSAVHFYRVKPGMSQPQMLVVGDVENVFLPAGEDLICQLGQPESRGVLEKLFDKLPVMFAQNKTVDSALGSALRAGFGVIRNLGGKLIVSQCAMPSVGTAKLRVRDDPKLLGTERETQLLNPEEPFYKNFALDCSRSQVSVDVYCFSSTAYTDVPAMGIMPQITGGELRFYPVAVLEEADKESYFHDLSENIIRVTGYEAVMRVRCSKGVNVAGHYGNFFIRSTDLLALPNCDSDKAFGVTFQVTETLMQGRSVSVQAALLYTTSTRERRIRVLTTALNVTTSIADLFKGADVEPIVHLAAQVAADRALQSKLSDGRDVLLSRCLQLLVTYRTSFGASAGAQQLLLPESLKLLPLYTLAALKSIAFRAGTDIRPADRSAALYLLRHLPVHQFIAFIYPRLFPIHAMDAQTGLKAEDGSVSMPPVQNLSSERFDKRGMYLLSDGQCFMLWVGRQTAPELLYAVFAVQSFEQIDPRTTAIVPNADPTALSTRLLNIISYLRALAPNWQRLHILREGDVMELRFWAAMIEDKPRGGAQLSYYEFLQSLQKEVAKATANP
jgi:protein transport protein SEC24